MSDEHLPLYTPGFSISKDRHDHLVDMAASLTERYCVTGDTWRIDTDYITLASAGSYHLVTFTTPATGRCYYGFAEVSKTGAEVMPSLLRAPVVSGGTPAIGFNYNDEIPDSNCPLINITNGGTYTGGVERFKSLLPGDANPANRLGGNSRSASLIILRQNTTYALKLRAVGGAATIAAHVGIVYLVN